ncbi:MAG TPA: mandelate racemase/muconate lactonizing enzyme family protein [Alphaproteobacteria bacterium]|nr:mandelate racemase/muconate lactonizing enzyme family protein [Alphaproteobacteria bacterium]
MKITNVKAYALRTKLDTPFAFSQGWVHERGAALVEIETDAGVTGWGEALCQGLQPPDIAAAVIKSSLAPLVIGRDPRDVEVLWHKMYAHTRDFGGKGAVIGAISAIDIALWDILGQSVGLPVWRLLGGAFRKRVQVYATGFYRIRGQGEAKRLADEAVQRASEGFTAMKIKLGFGIEDDLKVMNEIGRAIEGRGITLMIDTNHGYGYADALRLGRALADYHLRWYEEPVVPDDLDGYRALRAALGIPIAGGENEYTGYGFKDLLRAQAIDIAQPDIAAAGGFTACRHIVALCQTHGVQVNPHVWGSSVSQVASLHLCAALPVAHHGLFASEPIFEYDCSAHPFRMQLIKEPLVHRNGWLDLPQRPGLGIEVDRKTIDQYAA